MVFFHTKFGDSRSTSPRLALRKLCPLGSLRVRLDIKRSSLVVISTGLGSLGVIFPAGDNRLSSSSSSSSSCLGLTGVSNVLGTNLLLSGGLGLREFLWELQAVTKDLSRLLVLRPSNTFLYISILLWVTSSLEDSARSAKVPATVAVEQRSGVNSPMEPVDMDLEVELPSWDISPKAALGLRWGELVALTGLATTFCWSWNCRVRTAVGPVRTGVNIPPPPPATPPSLRLGVASLLSGVKSWRNLMTFPSPSLSCLALMFSTTEGVGGNRAWRLSELVLLRPWLAQS